MTIVDTIAETGSAEETAQPQRIRPQVRTTLVAGTATQVSVQAGGHAFIIRAIHIDAVDSADHFAVRHGLSSGSTARVPGQERGPGGLCGRSAGRGLATMSR